ncbi:MAG TPA: 2-amino-4-hydroxy-6-hydroxymethyldihydropteridine diphosphokinase [Anaerolineaceae bacterium]|nr:2-amino-4-hydroxy-6-hydroxymethyldihydropteridine diphosphokinase [Anaerolineaceae bacterium]HPN53274.1 2-amino-4-hydroxy-6-hydroxymethyldihydropteridine diphosphokinase [Anaerolineaceae bacterium]
MMETVYLATGTNLGERAANLRHAREELARAGVTVTAVSLIYETPPWGYLPQPHFLNQVLQAQTALSPLELLKAVKKIEKHLGREPAVRYGPRLIDLDILFYGDHLINEEHLVVPHPRLHERAFVLVPLNDLVPDLVHPLLKQTIHSLLAGLPQSERDAIHPWTEPSHA